MLPLLPELERLTGPLPAPAPLEPHEQPLRLVGLLHALLRVLVRHVTPMVMVLDDLQWADSLSLEWIAGLLEDPELPGLVLLGLFRTTAASRWKVCSAAGCGAKPKPWRSWVMQWRAALVVTRFLCTSCSMRCSARGS